MKVVGTASCCIEKRYRVTLPVLKAGFGKHRVYPHARDESGELDISASHTRPRPESLQIKEGMMRIQK